MELLFKEIADACLIQKDQPEKLKQFELYPGDGRGSVGQRAKDVAKITTQTKRILVCGCTEGLYHVCKFQRGTRT